MMKTNVKFDKIKEDKDFGLMFGCFCGNNENIIDAVISLLGVSIKGQRITTFDKDGDIIYIGFGNYPGREKLYKCILYKNEFVISHVLREFIYMEEP